MTKMILILTIAAMGWSIPVKGADHFEKDVFTTTAGELTITFIGHGTLMMEVDGKVIHIDPYSKLADYSKLHKADILLITHEHRDHLDPEAYKKILKPDTQIIISGKCASELPKATVMHNGDSLDVSGIKIEAVPAYNIDHKRPSGVAFHPKGEGNGYVLTVGDKRIYVAGDTENIPEMKTLKNIDVAFLPMNLPYTMTPEMAADAALSFKPAILYPYHYGETDPARLVDLLKDHPEIEVRVRPLR